MGDCQKCDLRVDFDRTVRLTFVGSKVTSDAGLLAYRERDEALGLTVTAGKRLEDSRTGRNTRHALLPLIRQSIYSRLAGYEDVNDAERLCGDPAMRHIVGGRASQPEKMAASSSELGRFETEMLASPRNLTTLMNLPGEWVDSVSQRQPLKKLILDMDSSVSETYGNQQGAAYNGHFECCCYHPLFLFNQFGDVERVMLRRGNHASAKYWRRVLLPVIARYDHCQIPKFFRGDAAFAEPALYGKLEQSGYRYAIRLKSNPVLERRIARLLVRPVGRPSRRPKVFYVGFHYQAKSWDRRRRVVAKVEWRANELFPRVGFIVTNLAWQARKVVKFYNGRGTAEQWIKEGKNAVRWTRLSCQTFRANHARLQLFALAYNLGTFLRRLALPKSVRQWSLTTLKEKLVKIGAKVTRHAKYVTFQLAEVAVPRQLFASTLERIGRLRHSPALCPSS